MDNLTNRDYNRFYLNLFADNALVIFNALSPDDADIPKRAKAYAERLDALAQRAEKNTEADQPEINRDAAQAVQDVRKFFVYILDRTTSEDFHLDLKPTMINSFVLETEKYLDILDAFEHGRAPVYRPIEEEVFWLLIFSNLCKYISDNLGNFQKRYRDQARELAQTLNEYWSFSVELKSIISHVGDRYTRLADEHHIAVNEALLELYEFMSTIIQLQQENRIPGSLSLLNLERGRRVVCFYLLQWAKSINAQGPDCNPYAARISRY